AAGIRSPEAVRSSPRLSLPVNMAACAGQTFGGLAYRRVSGRSTQSFFTVLVRSPTGSVPTRSARGAGFQALFPRRGLAAGPDRINLMIVATSVELKSLFGGVLDGSQPDVGRHRDASGTWIVEPSTWVRAAARSDADEVLGRGRTHHA